MGLTVRFASTLINSNIVIVCGRCAYGPLCPNEDDAYFSGFKTFTELFSICLVIQLPTCFHLVTFKMLCHIWDIQTGQVHMTWGDLPPWMRTVHWVWPTTTERQTAVLCKASQMTPGNYIEANILPQVFWSQTLSLFPLLKRLAMI